MNSIPAMARIEDVLRADGWFGFEIATHRATRADPTEIPKLAEPSVVNLVETPSAGIEYHAGTPNAPTQALADLLIRRRSHRKYSGQALSVAELCAVVGPAFTSSDGHPSCALPGGHRTISPLVIAANMIDGRGASVPQGIYTICPEPFRMTSAQGMDFDRAAACVDHRDVVAPAALLLLCLRTRAPRRYLNAYELSLLEAGQLLQNISLIATAAGVGSCALGSVFDEPLWSAVAGMAPREQALRSHGVPIVAVALGHIDEDKKEYAP